MPPPSESPRFNFAVQAWGQRYIDVLLGVGLPSQLSPHNLPGFPWLADSIYEIYTTRQEQDRITGSPVFRQLARIIETRFIHIEDILARPSWSEDARKWPALRRCHQQIVRAADAREAAVFFLCPDQIWSDGSLTNAGARIVDGYSAVLCPGPRAIEESMVPAVRERFLSTDGCSLSIPARELVRLGFEHIHPEMRRWFWDAPDYLGCPTYVFFDVPDEGVLASCYILHPVAINAEVRHAPFRRIFDQDYLRAACPTLDRIHVAQDSDDIIHFEVSPADENCSAAACCPPHERLSAMHIRGDFEYNDHHRVFARQLVRLHHRPVTPAVWNEPEARARHIARRVEWRLSLPDWILCLWEPRALVRRIEGRSRFAPDAMSERDRMTRELARALIDHRAAGRSCLRELALQSALPTPTNDTASERDAPSTADSSHAVPLEHADTALERGQHQLALARYLTTARAQPGDAATWLGVSRVFLATGQLDRATDVVDRAIALQPHLPEAHALRAAIRRQRGDAPGELAALTQAVTCAPDDGVLWDTLIGALEREADAGSVLAFIDGNRDVIPSTVPLTLRQSRLHASLGQADIAERLLKEAQTDHPGAPELCSALALLYLQTNRHADAVAALERAVASAPRDVELQRTLVAVIENLNGPAAAADHLRQRTSGATFDLALAVHAARLYVSADRLGDAAAQLHEIIRPDTDVDTDPAVALLSSDADCCGRLTQALEHAVRLSPGQPQHWHTLLVHVEDVWGPRSAARFLDRHHALVPADPGLDLRIARLCVVVGCIGPALLQALRRIAAPELSDAAAARDLERFLEDLQHGTADDVD